MVIAISSLPSIIRFMFSTDAPVDWADDLYPSLFFITLEKALYRVVKTAGGTGCHRNEIVVLIDLDLFGFAIDYDLGAFLHREQGCCKMPASMTAQKKY